MAADGTGTRAVVVTGASTGIGEACALRMDKLGWRVFAGVRNEADAQRLRQEASGQLTPIMLDVTDQAQIEAAAKTVGDALGEAGLSGLVNNAGVSVPGPLEFLPIDELRRQLEVNVSGQIAVTQASLPLLRRGHGRIVNIGSISGKLSTPLMGAYCASKFAMEALTDALRQELRPWGIDVAIVEPGNINTPIWQKGQTYGDEMEKRLPQEALALYRPAINALREAARKFEGAGIPPDR